MAAGQRIRELLMAERDGTLGEQQAADIALLRDKGRFPPALQGPPTQAPQPSGTDLLAKGIVGSGFGTSRYDTPEQRVGRSAFAARTLPGLLPPGASAVGSAAGEVVAQGAEMGAGIREEFDPVQVGVAGALPPVAAGVGRVARGVGRTATRLIPSRFRAAHQQAFGAAQEVGERLAPDVNPSQLFEAARKAGVETIPAGNTTKILASLDDSLPAEPANTGLKTVRAHMTNVQKALEGFESAPLGVGTPAARLNVKELMKLRRDVGADLTKAKEMQALYKGLLTDLEEAAKAGGPAASMAKEALTAFKRDLGVAKFNDLVEAATANRAIFGADTRALDVAKLAKSFAKEQEELVKLVGPEGVQMLGAFIQRFKALPPDVAYNGWGRLIGAVLGAGGIATGNLPTAAGTAVGLDTLVNAFIVGKNPAVLNKLMTTLVQAARAATATPERE